MHSLKTIFQVAEEKEKERIVVKNERKEEQQSSYIARTKREKII